jgi:nitroimidazol reductase NimA-like FMN-containing flavoprotein (pyridoxamine 5'-phosphate oxidase superfamily)
MIMRRSDREIKNFQDIVAVLDKCEIIHIAMSRNDIPYIVPMNFGYVIDGEKITIYLHGAQEGKKHDIIAKNSSVCFDGVSWSEIVPSADNNASKWTTLYQSVIGEGQISIVSDDDEKIKGLNSIMQHCGFKGIPQYLPQSLNAVKVLKIKVNLITGKQHLK